MPVQVSPEGRVLRFPKAIDVGGGQAGGDAEEHVIEGEAQELRVPTVKWKATLGKNCSFPTGFTNLTF